MRFFFYGVGGGDRDGGDMVTMMVVLVVVAVGCGVGVGEVRYERGGDSGSVSGVARACGVVVVRCDEVATGAKLGGTMRSNEFSYG